MYLLFRLLVVLFFLFNSIFFFFLDKKPPEEWPNEGKIIFKNFYLRYEPNAPYVLKDINIVIEPTEKVIYWTWLIILLFYFTIRYRL